ncbi:metallophosphoesterase [Catenibacillus scindens]|uniref:metallophosphoesterase n=1 Tax=Catenibacillus scindens TaxID=673271 RepID=UPI00320843EB
MAQSHGSRTGKGVWWNNRPWETPVVRTYTVKTSKVKRPVRCLHLSDLHCCWYGHRQSRLLKLIWALSPDLVCMTGDMLERKFWKEAAGDLMEPLAGAVPCFFVAGNHEFHFENYRAVKKYVSSLGVHVLEGSYGTVDISGAKLHICGVDDPINPDRKWKDELGAAARGCNGEDFSVLLTHRPELARIYSMFPFDLVLSGHAHGGQWRLPGLINGLYAPGQGIFPSYTGGAYKFGSQTQIVSRGLAYYTWIPRIFNPVEMGLIHILPK